MVAVPQPRQRKAVPDICLTFQNLTLGYNQHPAVHHLSGIVNKGSLLAVVGGNGSGKSTLLKGIAGLLKPLEGSCSVAAGTRCAYLPQQSEVDRSFPARVIDLVSLGLWQRRGFLGRHSQSDKEAVLQALVAVGLENFQTRPLDTLSGGQMQRALFARVIVQNADLILLDEPFNAVDERTIIDLIDLIKAWHCEGRIVVVHDFDLVRQHFPDTLLLARHKIAWGPSSQTLGTENLQRARHYREAWNETAPWCDSNVDAHAARVERVEQ